MANDLTIIYLTGNEHPEHWDKFQWETLLKAAESRPIIPVVRSRHAYEKFLLAGYTNVILDEEPKSHWNMYRQLLKACKLATTPYIATAESDVLYSAEHFKFYRPPMDAVAYNMSRWMLFTWHPRWYSLRYRISNCTLIAPREYYIQALEERYGDNAIISREASQEIVGEVGRHNHEKILKLPLHNCVQVWSKVPVIHLNHENGTEFKNAHHKRRKNPGEIRAFDIPDWGKAKDLVKQYR